MSGCKVSSIVSFHVQMHFMTVSSCPLHSSPPPPPFSPPPYPLFPPPLHGSFSHSSDCSLTPSSSFPVTVVWISSLVARGLQADTTPPYMNGMCMMSTGNSFLFMQYHAVGNKYLYPNQNVLSGAQQEAVQHA